MTDLKALFPAGSSSILDINQDAYLILNQDWEILYLNNNAAQVLRISREKALNVNLWDQFPELASNFFKQFVAASNKKEIAQFEGWYPPTEQWFEITVYPDQQVNTICIKDITSTKKTLESMRQTELRWRLLFESVVDVILVIDERGIILNCNPAIEKIFGYTQQEIVGRNITILMQDADQHQHDNHLHRYLRTNNSAIIGVGREVLGRNKQGEELILELSISEIHIANHRQFVGVLRDVTARRKAEQEIKHLNSDLELRVAQRTEQLEKVNLKLEHLALYDSLTNVANRELFRRRLKEGIEGAFKYDQQLSLIVMDLNHFKPVNDTLGHHAGDLLLKEVALRGKSVVRESDTFARFGGDEFAVILNRANSKDAISVARKLVSALGEKYLIAGHEVFSGASLGIATYPEHGTTEDLLLKNADTAMYHAKREKNDYCLYNSNIATNNPKLINLVSEFETALEKGELDLHYQPIIDLKNKQVCGIEALLRWYHRENGILGPHLLLNLAQEKKLSQQLSEWVIDKALTQLCQLHKLGYDLVLRININTNTFYDNIFANEIQKKLAASHINHRSIVFEISETNIISNTADAMESLNRLHDLGVSLSVDDYGKGNSSLAYISQFPVKEIKLDPTLVNKLLEHPQNLIIESTINLAHQLGFSVVAEGVTNTKIQNELIKLRCDLAQGYYFSQPLPLNELIDWLGKHQELSFK